MKSVLTLISSVVHPSNNTQLRMRSISLSRPVRFPRFFFAFTVLTCSFLLCHRQKIQLSYQRSSFAMQLSSDTCNCVVSRLFLQQVSVSFLQRVSPNPNGITQYFDADSKLCLSFFTCHVVAKITD